MTLAEIRLLLDFREHPDRSCGEVDLLIARHLQQVHQRIEQMQQLERQLQGLQSSCGEPRTTARCGILQSLATDDEKRGGYHQPESDVCSERSSIT